MREVRARILVVRGGAIGDFVLTLPVLAALKERFSDCGVEVLGYPHVGELARLAGYADEVRPIESRALAGFFARGAVLDAGLADYFARFAIVVSFLYDPDGVFRENVARCSKAQFLVGPHRPDELGGAHAVEVFLKPLERLAIFDAETGPRIPLDVAERRRGVLALHPGSGSHQKNWPEARWMELAKELGNLPGREFLVVSGEAEEGRGVRIHSLLPADRTQAATGLPLVDLARRLAACGVFVGHDSGITHLAAALGVPCVVLWGPSRKEVWRPLGERVRLLESAEGIKGITVAEVIEAIEAVAS